MFFCLSALVISGCAGLIVTEPILVDVIPEPERVVSAQSFGGVTVRMERFSDKRPSRELAQIVDKRIQPEGDVGTAVQAAFQRYIKEGGARVSLFDAAVTLSGDVRAWVVKVYPSFPLVHLEGEAAIYVEVFDSQNKLLYSARYLGSHKMRHLAPLQSTVRGVLGGAMQEALREAFVDERLAEALQGR